MDNIDEMLKTLLQSEKTVPDSLVNKTIQRINNRKETLYIKYLMILSSVAFLLQFLLVMYCFKVNLYLGLFTAISYCIEILSVITFLIAISNNTYNQRRIY